VYVDLIQRKARWKLVTVGERKKPSNGWRAAKLMQRRSAKTAKKPKKHRNRHKNNIAKHQNKNRDEGGRGRGKRTGDTRFKDIK
jgi:hypothetical protein